MPVTCTQDNGIDRSRVFLNEAIDIKPHHQHPLPWYPPVCVNIVNLKQGEMFLDNVKAISDRQKAPIHLPDSAMREVTLMSVS